MYTTLFKCIDTRELYIFQRIGDVDTVERFEIMDSTDKNKVFERLYYTDTDDIF